MRTSQRRLEAQHRKWDIGLIDAFPQVSIHPIHASGSNSSARFFEIPTPLDSAHFRAHNTTINSDTLAKQAIVQLNSKDS